MVLWCQASSFPAEAKMRWALVISAFVVQAVIAAPGYDKDVKQEEIVFNGVEGDIHKTIYVKEEIYDDENPTPVDTVSSTDIPNDDIEAVTESPELENSTENQENEPSTSAINNSIDLPQIPTQKSAEENDSLNENKENPSSVKSNANVLEIQVLAESMKKAFDNEVDRLVTIAEQQAATELSQNEPINEVAKLHNLYHVLANMKSANEHQNVAIDKSLQEIQKKIQEHQAEHHEHHNEHHHEHHHTHNHQPQMNEVVAEIEIIAEPQEFEFVLLPEVETVLYEIPLPVQPAQTSYRYPQRQNYYYPQRHSSGHPTQQYVEPIYYETDLIYEPVIVDQEPAPEMEEVEEQVTSKVTVDRGADPSMDVVKRQESYHISHSTNVKRPSLSPHHQHPQYYYVH